MSREIIELVHELERDRGIEGDTLIAALEDALLAAYKKTPGASRHAVVELDRTRATSASSRSSCRRTSRSGCSRRRASACSPSSRRPRSRTASARTCSSPTRTSTSTGPRSRRAGQAGRRHARELRPHRRADREAGDHAADPRGRAPDHVRRVRRPRDRGRDRDRPAGGDRNNVLVDLGKVEALLPRSEQVDGERYEQGSRIKAVITEVRSGTKGPQVILSRRDPELIRTLFELEVPEIADGLVEIRAVAREPGYRSKIAVESHAQGVDPVGACVGPRGSRVRMVVSELRGEKIDIIPWNPEPARFVAKALSPARVREVYLDDDAKEATVVIPDDQLALAIGKEGMNARLAARLTGWKVDIKSDTEFATEEAEAAFAGDGEEGERVHRPLRRGALDRQALPERGAAGLALLRRARAPGAGAQGGRRTRSRSSAESEPELEAARAREPEAEDGPSSRGARPAAEEPVAERRRAPSPSRAGRRRARRAGGRRRGQRRTRPLRERAGQDVRGLRPQGAAGRAVRFVAREGALTHAPKRARAAASTPAGGWPASSGRPRRHAFNRTLRQTVRVDPELARLYTERQWLTGPNRPNRPIRPRQGAPAGRRKRRVVIDTGAARPRQDSRQRRDRSDTRPKEKTPVAPLTGPVTVESGVTVKDLSQALGIPVPKLITILMGLGAPKTVTQSLSDEEIELIAAEVGREVHIKHAAEEELEPEVYEDDEADLAAAPAGRDDHGPRRPRQDDAAGRDPQERGRRDRGRRDHAAHRRLPGRPRRPQDHLPRHARPRGVHRHARPRREGHRHRGAGRGRRRRRDAADEGVDLARARGRGADRRRDQQGRPAGREHRPRAERARRRGAAARGVGRDDAVRATSPPSRARVSTTCSRRCCSSPTPSSS